MYVDRQPRHQVGLLPLHHTDHLYWVSQLGWSHCQAKTLDPTKFHGDDGNNRTYRPDRPNRIVLFLWRGDCICDHFNLDLVSLHSRTGRVLEILQAAD